jgi:predicted RND superfamily exporter protein
MVNRIPAIWELGAFAAIGVIFLTAVCLTFLPASLAMLSVEKVAVRARDGSPALERTLIRLARHVASSQGMIALAAAAVALVALVGLRRIQVDSDFLLYFNRRAEVRQASEIINAEIVGTNPFYVVIQAPQSGGIRQWQTLWYINQLQEFLKSLPDITSSISIVDYLELLESGLQKSQTGDLVIDEWGEIVDAPAPKKFWDDPAQLDPVLKMVATSPETFATVVTPDFRLANVLVRTRLSGSREIEHTLDTIRRWIAGHFPAEYPVRLTGNLVLMTGTTSEVVRGQVESLALAFGVIFLVLAGMFLSFRIGLLAILPNVLPVLVFFGLMGWLGIMLNVGTSLIPTIALGIAVDSTVHYMARLNRELRGEVDQAAAIRRTLATVGQPIVYTTVALVLGFLTFAFSSFVPIQSFGVLSSVTLAAGLGANLVLLPALLSTVRIITLWDLVGVKLGREPTREIPLFGGLRPSQARVVVLMGEVRQYQPGETIVRQGDQGSHMYVVLSGRTEAWAQSPDGTRHRLGEHRRGDVFGEMALVRRGERTADVIASTAVEALAVDERFLERIQRRYPRVASKVFLNLTKILSDRLERTNARFVAAQATGTAAAGAAAG